jgi:hypothetical protein
VLVALGATLAAVGGWRYARASAPVPGPIILITVDTLRADHLPAYGYRNVMTPAIDSLARDGIVFERAYGHAVQTLPAHIALLSGRLPFDTGVRDDAGSLKAGERLLPQCSGTGMPLKHRVIRTLGRETDAQGFNSFRRASRWLRRELTAAASKGRAESEAIAERWLSTVGSTRPSCFSISRAPCTLRAARAGSARSLHTTGRRLRG